MFYYLEKNNIIDYINHPKRIFPIGRLDKPSEGLIFLTNDGDIVNKILRARNHHEKEYIVSVNKPITDEFIKKHSTEFILSMPPYGNQKAYKESIICDVIKYI